MTNKTNSKFRLSQLFFILSGNLLYALSVKLFLLPAGLITGGTTGIALTINHYFGIPISLFVLIFNIIMLITGLILLGKQFALTTIASSFLYPLFLEVLDKVIGDFVLTDDLLLCTIFFGLCIGIALGIVIRAGASTGGMDIPPLVLQKYFRIPVSVSLYAFDFCVILLQAIYSPIENVLYGILMALIYTTVIDKMLLLGTSKIQVKVVSEKHNEIREAILGQIDRGVTMLYGEGGYMRNETQIVMTVVSSRELPKLEKLIHIIDPESFMIISHITEVSGRGFSISRDYSKAKKEA